MRWHRETSSVGVEEAGAALDGWKLRKMSLSRPVARSSLQIHQFVNDASTGDPGFDEGSPATNLPSRQNHHITPCGPPAIRLLRGGHRQILGPGRGSETQAFEQSVHPFLVGHHVVTPDGIGITGPFIRLAACSVQPLFGPAWPRGAPAAAARGSGPDRPLSDHLPGEVLESPWAIMISGAGRWSPVLR